MATNPSTALQNLQDSVTALVNVDFAFGSAANKYQAIMNFLQALKVWWNAGA